MSNSLVNVIFWILTVACCLLAIIGIANGSFSMFLFLFVAAIGFCPKIHLEDRFAAKIEKKRRKKMLFLISCLLAFCGLVSFFRISDSNQNDYKDVNHVVSSSEENTTIQLTDTIETTVITTETVLETGMDNQISAEFEYDTLQTIFLNLNDDVTSEYVTKIIQDNNLFYTVNDYNAFAGKQKTRTIKVAYTSDSALQKHSSNGDNIEFNFYIMDDGSLHFTSAIYLKGVIYKAYFYKDEENKYRAGKAGEEYRICSSLEDALLTVLHLSLNEEKEGE